MNASLRASSTVYDLLNADLSTKHHNPSIRSAPFFSPPPPPPPPPSFPSRETCLEISNLKMKRDVCNSNGDNCVRQASFAQGRVVVATTFDATGLSVGTPGSGVPGASGDKENSAILMTGLTNGAAEVCVFEWTQFACLVSVCFFMYLESVQARCLLLSCISKYVTLGSLRLGRA